MFHYQSGRDGGGPKTCLKDFKGYPQADGYEVYNSFDSKAIINNVNPQDWMTDVLTRIPAHPVNKLQELLPHKWKPATSPQTQNSQEKQ